MHPNVFCRLSGLLAWICSLWSGPAGDATLLTTDFSFYLVHVIYTLKNVVTEHSQSPSEAVWVDSGQSRWCYQPSPGCWDRPMHSWGIFMGWLCWSMSARKCIRNNLPIFSFAFANVWLTYVRNNFHCCAWWLTCSTG